MAFQRGENSEAAMIGAILRAHEMQSTAKIAAFCEGLTKDSSRKRR